MHNEVSVVTCCGFFSWLLADAQNVLKKQATAFSSSASITKQLWHLDSTSSKYSPNTGFKLLWKQSVGFFLFILKANNFEVFIAFY